jgi:hypothetical protein
MATLVAISAGLTASLTCVVPFAALAVAAATLPTRQALLCTAAVWLANQASGFLVLTYPWTRSTLEWGVAMGVAAMLATVAAQWLLRRLEGLRFPTPMVTAFAAAFVLYESMLYAVALVLGGTAAFAPSIVMQVLSLNAVTLVALGGLAWLLSLRSPAYRRLAHVPRNL